MRKVAVLGMSLVLAVTLGACGAAQGQGQNQNQGATAQEDNQNTSSPENDASSQDDGGSADNSTSGTDSYIYHQVTYDQLKSIDTSDSDAKKVSITGTVISGSDDGTIGHVDAIDGQQGAYLFGLVMNGEDGAWVIMYDSLADGNLPTDGQQVTICGVYLGSYPLNGVTEPTVAFIRYGEADSGQSTQSSATVPTEYTNALKKAKQYSDNMHMSKQGLYEQLTSEYGEKFSAEAAQYAIDNLDADYNANALAKAKEYEQNMAMSPAAIYDQLTSEYGEQFTAEEAQYAIDHLGD